MKKVLPADAWDEAAFPQAKVYQLWSANLSRLLPARPPYNPDLKMTPLSSYGEADWVFPLEWGAVNARDRLKISHASKAKLLSGAVGLEAGELIYEQLKQATVVYFCRRSVLMERRVRVRYSKPTGLHASHASVRRLLCAAKSVGCRSIRDITPETLEAITREVGGATGIEKLVDAFEDLIAMSKFGLIDEGLREYEFEISVEHSIQDVSGNLGWQPIDDDDLQRILSTSVAIIESADEFCDIIADSDQFGSINIDRAREILASCVGQSDILEGKLDGTVQYLLEIFQAAVGNLISFHTGMRASELLSLKDGWVKAFNDEALIDPLYVDMSFTTFKLEESVDGRERLLIAHRKLLEFDRALARVRSASGCEGPYLFSSQTDRLPYITNRWNFILSRWCRLMNVKRFTSHGWRKTVGGLAIRIISDAALHIKELFGHKSIEMVARYLLSSLFIRQEIRDGLLDEYRKRGRTLLESISAIGGDGLGGPFGHELENRFAKLLGDGDLTQIDLGQTLDEWLNEMMAQGIYPRPVMPGVMCMKPMAAVGKCASSSGDRLADPGKCDAECAFQVQSAHRRSLIVWTVERMASRWQGWSALQQKYWLDQIRRQVVAWPALREDLKSHIAAWPNLAAVIGDER